MVQVEASAPGPPSFCGETSRPCTGAEARLQLVQENEQRTFPLVWRVERGMHRHGVPEAKSIQITMLALLTAVGCSSCIPCGETAQKAGILRLSHLRARSSRTCVTNPCDSDRPKLSTFLRLAPSSCRLYRLTFWAILVLTGLSLNRPNFT